MCRSPLSYLLFAGLASGLSASDAFAQDESLRTEGTPAYPVVGSATTEPSRLDLVERIRQRLNESAARGEGVIPLHPSELPGGGLTARPGSDQTEGELPEAPPAPPMEVLGDAVPLPEEPDAAEDKAVQAGRGEARADAESQPEPSPAQERKPYVPLPSKTVTIRSADDLRSLATEITDARERRDGDSPN